ncbi:MAG TPA: hypothetical protein VFM06_01465 [Candidatus Limnocylindria bacterium]|nr:hypothetical protein [Candidatus Limnocylindria bacterium]
MAERRLGSARRRLPLVLANATVLVLLYGAVVIAGARSNAQGAIERAAFGTLILFWLAVLVQLLLLLWFERRLR